MLLDRAANRHKTPHLIFTDETHEQSVLAGSVHHPHGESRFLSVFDHFPPDEKINSRSNVENGTSSPLTVVPSLKSASISQP